MAHRESPSPCWRVSSHDDTFAIIRASTRASLLDSWPWKSACHTRGMQTFDSLSRMRALPDGTLLSTLEGLLLLSRRTAANIIVFLGEVEQRRLHLLAGYGSMFAYCTCRLGMSEDEAYRRIEVSRLTRRFPEVGELLAAGKISLSVATLLRQHLTDGNRLILLEAVSGKTVAQAREVLAAWYPRPDVPASIRKLPSRSVSDTATAFSRDDAGPRVEPPSQPSPACGAARPFEPDLPQSQPATVAESKRTLPASLLSAAGKAGSIASSAATTTMALTCDTAPEQAAAASGAAAVTQTDPSNSPLSRSPSATTMGAQRRSAAPHGIEPLSPDRYRLQLTVSAALKQKLELARDLLRHTLPGGDLAALLERALDVLLEQTAKRRFAVTSRPECKTQSSFPAIDVDSAALSAASPAAPAQHVPTPSPPNLSNAAHPVTSRMTPHCRHVPNAVRRNVYARDGARCSWRGPDGTRCNSRAWIEHDHITPHGQGGGSRPSNIRHLCRAHNRLAAEQAYGQDTITRIIERRRFARRSPPVQSMQAEGHVLSPKHTAPTR